MKNKDKISIIVPIYNTGKYLKKCIDSLINQTYDNLEIILINDGSKDNSSETIKSYNDKRIKYFNKKNEGIGKTRNFGIEKATGDYLMFIDSDDYISDKCCEEFINNANKKKSDLIVSDYYKDKNGKLECIKLDDFKDSTLKENNKLLLIINHGPCNKLYKRSLIIDNKIRFNEEYKYEDTPFVIECIDKAKKISKINEALSYYCIHSNSETTVRDKRVFDILKIVDIVRNNLKDKGYLKDTLDEYTVDILTNYTIQMRYQQDKKIRNKFIDNAFDYLKENVKDYKSKKYYKNKSFIRRQIERHKGLTKLYCNLVHKKYR